jgi:hypothetical protein
MLTLEKTNIRESRSQAFREAGGSGQKREITIIEAGWGSSGYYSEAVLERDIPRIFPAGTHMYLNHPTESEDQERPERDLRDLVAVFETDPFMAGIAAVTTAHIFEHWLPVFEDEEFCKAIGCSIRAFGIGEDTDMHGGNGRPEIKQLTEGLSVDFVTMAGANGAVGRLKESVRTRVFPLMEAARTSPKQDEVVERLASDTREQLNDLGQESWGSEDLYIYCEDFDETAGYAIFWLNPDNDAGYYYKQAISSDENGDVTFSGDPETVDRETSYVPAKENKPPPTPQLKEESRNAGHWLEAFIHRTFTERCDSLFGEGYMTREERIICSEAIGLGLQAFSGHLEDKAPQLFERDPYAEFEQPEMSYLNEKQDGSNGRTKQEVEVDEKDRQRLSELEESVRKLTGELEEAKEKERKAVERADRADEKVQTHEAARVCLKATNAIEALRTRPKAQARVIEAACRDLPTDSDGRLDKDALEERARNKARDELEYLGVTTEEGVTGLGESSSNGGGSGKDKSDDVDPLAEAMEGLGMPEGAAKVAAEGR